MSADARRVEMQFEQRREDRGGVLRTLFFGFVCLFVCLFVSLGRFIGAGFYVV